MRGQMCGTLGVSRRIIPQPRCEFFTVVHADNPCPSPQQKQQTHGSSQYMTMVAAQARALRRQLKASTHQPLETFGNAFFGAPESTRETRVSFFYTLEKFTVSAKCVQCKQ